MPKFKVIINVDIPWWRVKTKRIFIVKAKDEEDAKEKACWYFNPDLYKEVKNFVGDVTEEEFPYIHELSDNDQINTEIEKVELLQN